MLAKWGIKLLNMPNLTRLSGSTAADLAMSAVEALAEDPATRKGALCPLFEMEGFVKEGLQRRNIPVHDARYLDLYDRRDINGIVGHLHIIACDRFDAMLDRISSLFPLLDQQLIKELRALKDDASTVYEAFINRSGYMTAALGSGHEGLVEGLVRLGEFIKNFTQRSHNHDLVAFMAEWEAYRLTDGGAGSGIRFHTPVSLKGQFLETLLILVPDSSASEWSSWLAAAQQHATERLYIGTLAVTAD
ncbi:MAG: hypothetical protein HY692_04335 [Cyanobacteria bacterium NC_groundwater_1444_Ag_S-0.65um_54_12]|nr:hypothetical protein [Cyanobacteria bacterium NC_groundwater_1444_Ag_S-0.65um_54_12]